MINIRSTINRKNENNKSLPITVNKDKRNQQNEFVLDQQELRAIYIVAFVAFVVLFIVTAEINQREQNKTYNVWSRDTNYVPPQIDTTQSNKIYDILSDILTLLALHMQLNKEYVAIGCNTSQHNLLAVQNTSSINARLNPTQQLIGGNMNNTAQEMHQAPLPQTQHQVHHPQPAIDIPYLCIMVHIYYAKAHIYIVKC